MLLPSLSQSKSGNNTLVVHVSNGVRVKCFLCTNLLVRLKTTKKKTHAVVHHDYFDEFYYLYRKNRQYKGHWHI